MLGTPFSEVVWRVLATHCICQFHLHFHYRASPCAITFQLESNKKQIRIRTKPTKIKSKTLHKWKPWTDTEATTDLAQRTVLIIKPTTCTNFSNSFLEKKIYIFRTVPLSIIRGFSLYTQHWCMSYSLRAGSGPPDLNFSNSILEKKLHVSDSSSVHHQEIFTIHTAMIYVIQVCWQLASRINIS